MTHDFVLITACHPRQADLSRARTCLKRSVMCFYIYRRRTTQKVTRFFKISLKIEKRRRFRDRNTAFLTGPSVTFAALY